MIADHFRDATEKVWNHDWASKAYLRPAADRWEDALVVMACVLIALTLAAI